MGMRIKQKKPRRVEAKFNLNLILWFSFSLFSVLIISVFSIVQNVVINQQMREKVIENTREAATTLQALFKDTVYEVNLNAALQAVANEYLVSIYLISAEGDAIYPSKLGEEDAAIIEKVFEARQNAQESGEQLPNAALSKTEYILLLEVVFGQEEHYLYISGSFEAVARITSALIWFSVIMALFAVAFGFVVSGFVSMVITNPISEVTKKAKELAKGDYDVKFGGNAYCTEVAELSDALDFASSEISKADKMQKELIANVSHDFKTPLTMIKAYASMIQEISGADPEKRKKHTQVIIDEADRLATLVGDLLDLSKMQAGIESFEKTVFNLSEEIYRVAGRFLYLTDTQNYIIDTEIDDDCYTYAVKSRVEQVLYNLIGNAVNYTGEDKKVLIRLKKLDNVSRFEVIDSGKGIAEEELDTIWERYYRSEESHKRPIKGTGLGLSIVKTILKKHNINFGVRSQIDKGSCFWVDFPVPPEDVNAKE